MRFGKLKAKAWDFGQKRALGYQKRVKKRKEKLSKRSDERRQHKIRREYGKHTGQVEYYKRKEMERMRRGNRRKRAGRFMKRSMREDLTGGGRYSW